MLCIVLTGEELVQTLRPVEIGGGYGQLSYTTTCEGKPTSPNCPLFYWPQHFLRNITVQFTGNSDRSSQIVSTDYISYNQTVSVKQNERYNITCEMEVLNPDIIVEFKVSAIANRLQCYSFFKLYRILFCQSCWYSVQVFLKLK